MPEKLYALPPYTSPAALIQCLFVLFEPLFMIGISAIKTVIIDSLTGVHALEQSFEVGISIVTTLALNTTPILFAGLAVPIHIILETTMGIGVTAARITESLCGFTFPGTLTEIVVGASL
jgi:hypothetical protein